MSHRNIQLKLNHVHNVFYNNCPDYLSQDFKRLSDVHSYFTRSSSHNFFVPSVNGLSSKSFYYTGILSWNSLPQEIKCIENKGSFKKHLKKFLNNEMFRLESDVFYYY